MGRVRWKPKIQITCGVVGTLWVCVCVQACLRCAAPLYSFYIITHNLFSMRKKQNRQKLNARKRAIKIILVRRRRRGPREWWGSAEHSHVLVIYFFCMSAESAIHTSMWTQVKNFAPSTALAPSVATNVPTACECGYYEWYRGCWCYYYSVAAAAATVISTINWSRTWYSVAIFSSPNQSEDKFNFKNETANISVFDANHLPAHIHI